MNIIRGTTPTITINIINDIDLTQATALWVYIYQQDKVKINKELSDVTIDAENRKILVTLSQADTLALAASSAIFQFRLLMSDGTALAIERIKISIEEIYKGGEITI